MAQLSAALPPNLTRMPASPTALASYYKDSPFTTPPAVKTVTVPASLQSLTTSRANHTQVHDRRHKQHKAWIIAHSPNYSQYIAAPPTSPPLPLIYIISDDDQCIGHAKHFMSVHTLKVMNVTSLVCAIKTRTKPFPETSPTICPSKLLVDASCHSHRHTFRPQRHSRHQKLLPNSDTKCLHSN